MEIQSLMCAIVLAMYAEIKNYMWEKATVKKYACFHVHMYVCGILPASFESFVQFQNICKKGKMDWLSIL